jgi:hypothetical protein
VVHPVGDRSTSDPPRLSDQDWYLANFQRLVAEYPDQWLAIRHGSVIAAARTPSELRELLRTASPQRSLIVRADPSALMGYK